MQILLDEDKRVLSTCEDEMEVQYPDERWIVISMSDDTVFEGDFIDNRWDGTQIIYDPKQILGG